MYVGFTCEFHEGFRIYLLKGVYVYAVSMLAQDEVAG